MNEGWADWYSWTSWPTKGLWWVTASGTVDADSVLHTFRATACRRNARFIRFTMKSNHGNELFMDVLEAPSGQGSSSGVSTPRRPNARRSSDEDRGYAVIASPSGETTYQTSLTPWPLTSSAVSSAAK